MTNRIQTIINIGMLLLSLLIGGNIAVWLGKELCWDLANYHYYNPYSLLYQRENWDYWPSSFIHVYISPTIDLLSYYLITYFRPLNAVFILGAIHGLNLWLVFLIARLFTTLPFALIIAAIGLYGPTAFPGIGSFQNDNLVSLFVLGFLYLSLCNLKKPQAGTIFCANLLLGIGIGLKLTAGIFLVGAALTTMVIPHLTSRARLFGISLIAVLIGISMSSGYWMLHLWHTHHNPVFPFFNHLFHSPDFATENWFDPRFFPQGFWQQLAYPFYFSWDGRIADVPFCDIRLLLVYILCVISAGRYLFHRKKMPTGEAWLFAFFIFSYITWQIYFSIARYMVSLELLAPLVIYLLLRYLLVKKELVCGFFLIVFYLLLYTTSPTPVVRSHDFSGSFFNTILPPSLPDKATVLMAYSRYALQVEPRPQTYLIPAFPTTWRFIGIPFANHQLTLDDGSRTHIQQILKENGPIYLLTSDENMSTLFAAATRFALVSAGACQPIKSDRQAITFQNVLLCPMRF